MALAHVEPVDDGGDDLDAPVVAVPRAYEMLSEEEACLYAILTDHSGIDTMEFTFPDESREDGCWRAWPFQVCFAGETSVLTKQGHRSIKSLVGKTTVLTEVATGRGKWVDAEVRSFGRQQIVELDIERYGFRKTIRTTAEHRWFADDRRRARRTYPETKTIDLQPGMFLKSVTPRRNSLSPAPFGIVHGLVWGDGTRAKTGASDIVLWGEKLECAAFMPGPGVPENRPDVSVPGRRWSLLPRSFKRPVDMEEAPSFLYGWLAGYFAADGAVASDGTCQLGSVSRESIELARDVCVRLGITVGPATLIPAESATGTYGEPTDLWQTTICSSDLDEGFFLRTSQRESWARAQTHRRYLPREWQVEGVRTTEKWEEVYCAIVPETHSFVLEGYILTGNCWWRDKSQKQVDLAARSVGKSESLLARSCSFPFRQPGQEMVITAPEGIHVDAITDRIEARITGTRLLSEMVIGGRTSIKHKPFSVKWANGSRIIGRIPQKTGVGMKGTHPVCLELDEAQDYPRQGWREIFATLNRALPGSEWRVHGVTKGVRDEFYEITQSGENRALDDEADGARSDWKVHRITALHRPTWTDKERADAIAEYGSEQDPDFQRNIYGSHGDAANALWVLTRFMACSDSEEGSDYNTEEYLMARLTAEMVEDRVGRPGVNTSGEEYTDAILQMLEFPESHRRYKTFWAGMDVGRTNDPSEILVFAEYVPTAEEKRRDQRTGQAIPLDGATRFKLLTRVQMVRIPAPLQADAVMHVIDFYKPKAFSLDATGLGFPVLDELQKRAHLARTVAYQEIDENADPAVTAEREESAKGALTVIKGYNFSSRLIIGIDEQKAAELTSPTPDELADKAGIRQNVKDRATDCVRELIDTRRLMLPWDGDLLKQWNGQTWSYSPSPIDAYGKRVRAYSKGVFHTLDAGRMAALGMFQAPIEQLLAAPPTKRRPVFAAFVS